MAKKRGGTGFRKSVEEHSTHGFRSPEPYSDRSILKDVTVEVHDFKPDYVFLTETSATPWGYVLREAYSKAYPGQKPPKFYRIDPSALAGAQSSRFDSTARKKMKEAARGKLKGYFEKRIDKENPRVIIFDELYGRSNSVNLVADSLREYGVNSDNIEIIKPTVKKDGKTVAGIEMYPYTKLTTKEGAMTSDPPHWERERLKPLIEWRDYGPEAFDESITQNKPIFLLLTAPSWCYWCQVYESEDYLFNPQVVSYINENFIPIYVDADQRQDLTRQYLEGGWPSTTIFTPSRERIYGYSGVRPVQNMLINLQQAKDYVNSQGFSNQPSINYQKTTQVIPTQSQLTSLISSYGYYILQAHDSQDGGFGTGQKFPQGRALDYSLEIYERTNDQQYLQLVQTTLQNQYTKIEEIETNYNLFDPVEGGFHRYGTRRDYTPPHFEKMLYDNAKLLKAYFHLQQLAPNGPVVKEVVKKTHAYVKTNWYDSKNGGFYGNTDVHGEEEYYGENPRPKDKPRVEKTKYTDWNSEAILTYLYLYEETKNQEYKSMAESSLDFYSENINDKGAFHFISPEGKKGVQGSLLDNSFLMLAFIQGYETLQKPIYLENAKKLADYSLENLYDWNSGGFFERNSPDKNLYAPGEQIKLSKPGQENGIITFALLKLYKQTSNPNYLNAAIKTLGSNLGSAGGLDSGYYQTKSAQYILENNLLNDFQNKKQQIENLEKEKQESFWLIPLLEQNIKPSSITGFAVSEEGLEKLDAPIFILIFISIIIGFLSFASPCTLPILPAFLAFSLKSEKRNIKGMSIAFFAGLAVFYTLLGMTVTAAGIFLKNNLTIFTQIAGIIIILMGLIILLEKNFPSFKLKTNKPRSYFGAFFFGAVFGLAWTPCTGPLLFGIAVLASTTGSVLSGGILLFSFAVGLAIPLIILTHYVGKVNKDSSLWRFIKGKEIIIKLNNRTIRLHTTSLISGILFIILGYLIFSGALVALNQYISTSSFQQWIYGLEDKILGLVS